MADLSRHLINDANNWFLLNPISDAKTKFDFSECMYSVPVVTGSSQCLSRGSGPFIVQQENALGLDLSMFNDDGSLSIYGWLFTIIGTWTGFAFLFLGVVWYSDLAAKLGSQFNALRGNQDAAQVLLPSPQ
jgi:hypothetical protein